MFLIRLLSVCMFILLAQALLAQNGMIKGVLQDAATQKPIPDARIRVATNLEATTDANGAFSLENIPYGDYRIDIIIGEFALDGRDIVINHHILDLGTVLVTTNEQGQLTGDSLISVVTLNDKDEQAANLQNISGVLSASRDVFVSTAAFTLSLGVQRFRLRGYDAENTLLYMNGVPLNDLETGDAFFSWFALNDIMRSREINFGLQPLSFAYGALGTSTSLDARASKQRKQLRFTYAVGNRAFTHRAMVTYSTGILKNGWAFSFSASRRWTNESFYTPGAFFDSWAYYASAEKRIGKHSIALTVLGTPTSSAGHSGTFQEMYDMMGSNYYNPSWGYQKTSMGDQASTYKFEYGNRYNSDLGVKRSSNVRTNHQPLIVLTHETKLGAKTNWTNAASFQFGNNGSTALDWYNAADPRPDYYRYLPSYANDSAGAAQITQAYQNDPSVSQINWDRMYEVNRNSHETVDSANGIQGNSVTGNRARYVLSERRTDSKKFYINSFFHHDVNDNLDIQGGLTYQFENVHSFQKIADLLGADYFVDIDRFAQRDSMQNFKFYQNDLRTTNHIVKKGDTYGYDYNSVIHNAKVWGQLQYTISKFDFFFSTELSNSTFWRKGNMQSGKFPDNSLGKSTVSNFFNYAFKGGATYKLDGRNYFFVNASYLTRAPSFRDAFVAPRVRDQIINNLKSENIYSFEGGYLLRAPFIKARAVGFFTHFANQFSHRTFFLDNAITGQDGTSTGGFVNYIMSGVSKQHAGVELAIDVRLFTGFTVNAVASIGDYIYTSRPTVDIYLDNAPAEVTTSRTAYLKNYFIAGMPQQAYNLGLQYQGKQFYWLNLNFSYFRNNWVDINPDRHTTSALAYVNSPVYQQDFVQPSSALGQAILGQTKNKDSYSLNFMGSKSFKIGKKYFLNISLQVSNILNSRNIVTNGYDQLRFDYADKNVDKFPARYNYSYGTNFLFNISFRM